MTAKKTTKKTSKKGTKQGVNELAQRLGGITASKRPTGPKANGSAKSLFQNGKNQSANPLLARLDALQKVHNGQHQNSSPALSNNPLAQRIRISDTKPKNPTKPKGPSSSKYKITPASITKQTQALQSARLKKQEEKQAFQKLSKKLPSNNNTTNNNNTKNPNVLTIKNASKTKFLKIKNLEYGTTINDLKVVLDEIGKTTLIKIHDLESGSSIAEVVFNTEAALENAHIQLNGALADGRKLRTEISKESEIPAHLGVRNGPRVFKDKT